MARMAEICSTGYEVIKLSDRNFIKTLENGIRFGKWVILEDLGERLDASLDPLLEKRVVKEAGELIIRLGDNAIP